MKRLIVATKNAGKVREIQYRLSALDIEVSSLLDEASNISIVEDADTFVGNAIKKAVTTAAAANRPALADDSGLEVDALDGRPGIYSARYGGENLDDKGRYELLLKELAEVPEKKRAARFQAALAFVEPGTEPRIFEGTVEGKIAFSPAGTNGFGYDPIFVPSGYDVTIASLGPEIKNRISHRGKALDAFVRWLTSLKE
ncbi:MAG: RdgB/HAM1 family non-canonical purine NTP pyrophosphatase [Proteobacteria bacterium]|nr:RdgB/HAM1 family non-canonical purine NTP pyrophosphatase [Pseudomonadota bacterium]